MYLLWIPFPLDEVHLLARIFSTLYISLLLPLTRAGGTGHQGLDCLPCALSLSMYFFYTFISMIFSSYFLKYPDFCKKKKGMCVLVYSYNIVLLRNVSNFVCNAHECGVVKVYKTLKLRSALRENVISKRFPFDKFPLQHGIPRQQMGSRWELLKLSLTENGPHSTKYSD